LPDDARGRAAAVLSRSSRRDRNTLARRQQAVEHDHPAAGQSLFADVIEHLLAAGFDDLLMTRAAGPGVSSRMNLFELSQGGPRRRRVFKRRTQNGRKRRASRS